MKFRTKAPFYLKDRWVWLKWSNDEPSKHAAILRKAAEIGALSWDFGQSDHEERSRAWF